jgi:ATP-dependent Lon protease
MTVALISALSGRAVCRDVAMTGEITLHGKVLPIGGLREKTLAAARSGIRRVIIPYGNLEDLDEVDAKVKDAIEFIPCKTVEEALAVALVAQKDTELPVCDGTQKGFLESHDTLVSIPQGVAVCEEAPI